MLIMKLEQMNHLLIITLLNKMIHLIKNVNLKKEEVKPEEREDKPEPKAKAKALPRTKKEVELVECEQCSKKMTLKSLRHSHPKNCKGAPTELLPVNPQKYTKV